MLQLIPKKIKVLLMLFLLSLIKTGIIEAQQNKDSLDYYNSKLQNENQLSLDSVVYYYKKARGFTNVYKKIHLLRNEANYLRKKGIKESSFRKISEALELAKTNRLKVTEGIIYLGVSHHYYHFNQFEPSYTAIFKSKELLEEVSDEEINQYNSNNTNDFTKEELLELVLFNIGTIALDNDDLEKAEQHFNESLTYSIKHDIKQGVIDAKLNLASLLHNRKRYIESNKAFDQLLVEYSMSKIDESLVYYNIASNYRELRDFIQAKDAIIQAIDLSTEIEDTIQLIDLYYQKSRIEKALKNYSNERQLLEESLQGAERIDDHPFKVELYQALAECEMATSHPEKANKWYQKMIILKDSLSNQDNYNLYQRIKLENKLSVQEKKNVQNLKIIENDKSLTRSFKLISILGILLVIVLIYALISSKKNYNRKIQLAQEKSKLEKATIEYERFQEEIETKRIQEDLKTKKRELMLSLLHAKKRKKKLKIIIKEFNGVENKSVINKRDIQLLKEFIINQDKDLDNNEEIQQKIVNTHKGFFTKLINEYPALTKTELKVLVYIRIGLETKEIADTQFVSIDAIRKTRHRIRKKLNLETKESLDKFILKY